MRRFCKQISLIFDPYIFRIQPAAINFRIWRPGSTGLFK